MYKKAIGITGPLVIALIILVISIFSSSQVVYVFGQSATPSPIFGEKVEVDYTMPYAGKIEPDHFLWPVKALRDRVWLTTSIKPVEKIKVMILLSDKRMIHAKNLISADKSDLGVSTLTKSEKYLEIAIQQEKIARSQKHDTKEVVQTLAMSVLKHRQVLEEILVIAPEDAKPVIVKTVDLNKRLFNEVQISLNEQGLPTPENPFKD